MEKKQILIVEDDVVVGENLKDNLEGLSYFVAGICTTGEEAVQKAIELRPDLILMDIKLEGEMDGVETYRKIQRELTVPVVYLTAYADEKIFPRLKETSPYGILNKPARIENIRSTIEVALYKFEMELAQKKANEAALEAKTAAERANQAKNKFLANTSHEIRRPINAIKGFTELLLKTRLSARQEGYVKRINISTDALLNLLNDILDLSKVEAGKLPFEKRNFSLRDTIKLVLDSQYPKAKEKDIRLDFFIAPDVPEYIKGDPVRIRQMINHLLGNAVKFTDEGYCKVEVHCKQPEGGRSHGVRDKVTLILSVSDTGIGIPENDQKAIFDSFEQGGSFYTRKFEGPGLGLAIAEQLAGKMGGKIELDSNPGKGSIFTVTADFEVGKGPGPEKAGKVIDSPLGAGTTKPLRILLAVDNEVNQEVITGLVRQYNSHDVTCVSNGEEAIEILKKHPFDLILMDVEMPVMGGIEAAEKIRDNGTNEFNSNIPIIVMTGRAVTKDREKYDEVGINDYITKPIDSNELHAVLQRVVNDRIDCENREFITAPGGIEEGLIIDRTAALRRLNGNKKFLNRITIMYRERIPGKIDELKGAIEEKNGEASRWFAHSINEYASQIGALKVSEIASEIEEALKNKELNSTKDLFSALIKEHRKVMKELKSSKLFKRVNF